MTDKHTLVERLNERADLPSMYAFVGDRVEALFDPENRHKRDTKPFDYLKSWLSMLRPFAYATQDESWGEMEKLLCIVMRNYIEMSRECGLAATRITALEAEKAELVEASNTLARYTTHNLGCALYQSSYAISFPDCSCGLDTARATLAKARQSDEGEV